MKMKNNRTRKSLENIRKNVFMEPKKEDFFSRVVNSDTLLLALIPVFSYSFVFIYQFGEFTTFEIPTFTYDFSLVTIFSVALIVTLLGIAFLMWFNNLAKPFLFGKIPEPLYDVIYPSFYIYSFFLIMLFIYIGLKNEFTVYLIGFLVYSIRYIRPFFSRGEGKYVEKLIKQENANRSISEKNIIGSISEKLGLRLFKILFFYAILLFIVFNLGRSVSLRKTNYIVASTIPECVILSSSGDAQYCYYFDRHSNTVKQEFIILNSTSTNNLKFSNQNLGHLSLEGISSTKPNSTSTITPTFTLPITSTPLPKATQVSNTS